MYEALDATYRDQNGALIDSFEAILGSWANGKGYPLVTISHDRQLNRLDINQKQFWSDPKRPREDSSWWIPLNMGTMDNPNTHQTSADDRISLRGDASKSVSVGDIEGFNPDDWYIVNIQQTGYYRVNYDTANWNRIIDHLRNNPDQFHVLNRAALLDDAFVLSKSGDVSYDIALSLTTYLREERDYIPWASVVNHFDDLDRMIHSVETSRNLMKFIADTIYVPYLYHTMDEPAGDEMMTKYAKTLIVNWACRAGNEDCLSGTHSMFTNMLENDVKVDVNLQFAVYCASLRGSTSAEYGAFMTKLSESSDQDERGRMIDALGCATDENNLMEFLESSLDENDFGYRDAEKPRVVMSVLRGNRNGAGAVIKFYAQNYEKFLEK